MSTLWELVKPEATTNLCTNPSFETNTTGWIASGTNTIAADTTTAKFGYKSLKCTYNNAVTLAAYTTTSATFPTTSTSYTLSAWLYVPSTWDGGNIQLSESSLTGATVSDVTLYTDGTTAQDKWVYIESELAIATDVAGFVILVTGSAPTAGRFVYLDGVQIEEKTYATTCQWSAAAHGSTSTRDALAWQGGRRRIFSTDLSVNVNSAVGIGHPQIDHNVSELGLSPGGHFQSSRYRTRVWQLIVDINGTSLSNLHNLKQTFLKELDPWRLAPVAGRGDPVRFIYTGNADDLYIDAYYVGGGEFNGRDGYTERFPIRLSSPDPWFRLLGDVAKVLDSEDSASFTLFARRDFDTGLWDNMGPVTIAVAGSGDAAAEEADGTVWFAGQMADINSNSTWDHIVTYDPVADSFSGVTPSGGANDFLDSLEVAADGTIYAGGAFTSIDGVSANRIASYSGGTWSALGTGMDGGVEVIKQGPDGLIYAGGVFTTSGGTTTRGIATWNGSAWAAVGPPSSGGTVYDLGWDLAGNLYVVGAFTNWDGTAEADYIAKWDGSAWSAVTTTVFNNTIRAIEFDRAGNFYVGGEFTLFGSDTYNRIAYFNGTTFVNLGTGVNNIVYRLAIDRASQFGSFNLWAGGTFTQAGGNTLADRMAIWDGSSWRHTDIDFGGSPTIRMIFTARNGDVYVSGNFNTATSTYAGSTTVTNSGSVLAYPIIYISRSGGTSANLQYVINRTTNAQLLFDYDLLDGETLKIDLRPGRRQMTSSHFGKAWKTLNESTIATFALRPGDNTITMYALTAGSPAMTAYMVCQQANLGVD